MSDVTSAPAASSVEIVIDLLGMLAYGQLVAFDRMAADARLAPDLGRRAMLSEMAGAEIVHYHRLASRLADLGADPDQATAPFRRAVSAYHDQTQPRDWLEALTKAYVGDSIADDFVREVAQALPAPDRELVLEVVHDTTYADFAAAEITAAIAADPRLANRLSMWARRLVGEAITQAQRVAATRPAFAALLTSVGDTGEAGGGALAAMLRRLTADHTARMTAVGLNN